jgi:hypothetical protein
MTERVLSKLKNRRVSYLNGDAGPLAIGAVLYHMQGAEARSQHCIDRYIRTCYMLFNCKGKYILLQCTHGSFSNVRGQTV